MLNKWLQQQIKMLSAYKFPVVDITEIVLPDDEVINYLTLALLLAHGNPYLIRDQYNLLLKDAEDNSLDILKNYLEQHIFPHSKRISTRVGNFGEVLASTFLIEFENFWFPIYKLRYREKKDWAMRLTDLCLIKRLKDVSPLVCYGEVKTISGNCDKDIAIKGHDSLVLGEAKDALSDPEILHFISTILYETFRFEEAAFISEILLGKIKYDKRHDLFIIHSKEKWTDEILERLEGHPLDQRLVDFSTKVVLISQLRNLIDTIYDRSTTITKALTKSMDKQQYLDNTYLSLETLMKDRQFQKNLAQVQARSIHEELSSIQPDIRYTFNLSDVWRTCDFIFSNSSLLLREGAQIQEDEQKRQKVLASLKSAAQSFEFLSKFSDKEEKEILLINSAICYHIAGYHANAQCIAKVVERNYLVESTGKQKAFTELDTDLTQFFRQALVSFLRRDIVKLQRITQSALSFVRSIQERLISDSQEDDVILNTENLYGHLFFQKSLLNFTQYCIEGRAERLIAAQKNIEKAHTYFQQTGDTRLAVIASESRTLLKLFEDRSTWSNIQWYGENLIENPIWSTYLRNLTLEKSVVEFWASQLKALRSGLLTSEDGFVIQMPTSAGKTFVAELSILATLTNSLQKRCLYIAPYRALVNEIEDKLAEMLGALGYRVSTLNGGFEFDNFQNFLAVESHVLVTTPEKADLLFRTRPEYFENISTIVIDEGHMLDEGIPAVEDVGEDKRLAEELEKSGTLGRGIPLEMLITRLKKKIPQVRFLFLSAVMSEINVQDFVAWLSKKGQEPLRIDKAERPSRQTIATFRWSKTKSGHNGQLQYYHDDITPTYVSYFLQKERYYTGHFTPTGKRQTTTWPDPANKVQTTAMLAAMFAKTGPVLVFCAMPSQVRNVVDNIIKSLKYLESSEKSPSEHLRFVPKPAFESFDLAMEWLGDEHPLTRGLHYGVGLHYGPLPDPVRQAVEDDFRAGNISILVSTNTLGQGVNMPVKTAIIYSLERTYVEEEERKTKKVKKRDFWNICGRAGRAGKETEGQIVFVTNSNNDLQLFKEYRNEQNIEVVESPLYQVLEALIEKRITQEELAEYLDPHVLALLAEEVVDTQDESAITNFLQTSLVGVQAQRNNLSLKPLTSTINHTSMKIHENVPDQALRSVFASTGLRVNSCKILEKGVDAFIDVLGKEISEGEANSFFLDERLLEFAFQACQNIPEMMLAKSVNANKPENELELVKDWVQGKHISEIRSKYWSATDKEDALGEYVADRVIYKLPWGFNGFLRILSFKLQKNYDELPLAWQHLPSMMKFGVNSVFACWVSSFGISSRQLALEVARHYQPTNDAPFMSFIKWLVNLPTEFIFQDLPQGSIAEKKRFIQKISRIVADDAQLQFILQRQTILECFIQGIPYGNRAEVAFRVEVGDELVLQAEPENQFDSSAIRILYEEKHIGYVSRDKAKIISREMRFGKTFRAYAKKIEPPLLNYPYPQIIITIVGQVQ
ncbi:hypothetical protein KSC_044390 [Ktedonobacter sp. SOSP1-52]|uniref:DEAD/DEAH box helicase n=1 Tax=Ktedonobacter sp. SOSP1-52 TaxID=2778366 RepID=UPI001916C8B8|nr:DEAD/DEAH box helicase [Ktedonobacter sp. SOSP1-52]GHO65547.1 hypothetical protein KSC_044390 [Ktedonobacter sp. SOSP1-52]